MSFSASISGVPVGQVDDAIVVKVDEMYAGGDPYGQRSACEAAFLTGAALVDEQWPNAKAVNITVSGHANYGDMANGGQGEYVSISVTSVAAPAVPTADPGDENDAPSAAGNLPGPAQLGQAESVSNGDGSFTASATGGANAQGMEFTADGTTYELPASTTDATQANQPVADAGTADAGTIANVDAGQTSTSTAAPDTTAQADTSSAVGTSAAATDPAVTPDPTTVATQADSLTPTTGPSASDPDEGDPPITASDPNASPVEGGAPGMGSTEG